MSENLSLDETIAKLKAEAQEALKNVILENKQRFEAGLVDRQQHLVEKLNPNLIKLNVGGSKFVTTLDTLSNIKDTKLHKMATGRSPITLDKKNRIFIDRNGKYFGYVLDCLRKGKIELPTSDSFLSSRVQKEFEFFGLVNVGSSSSGNSSSSQKEEAKVNSIQKVATPSPSLFGAAKPVVSSPLLSGAKPIAPGGTPFQFAPQPATFGTQLGGIFGYKPAAAGLAQFAKAVAKPATFGFQPTTVSGDATWTEGERRWRLSPEEDDFGGYCDPDRFMIEASGLDHQAIGDTLLTSGTHQWRIFTEESIPIVPNNGKKKAVFYEGIVTFGVVTKEIWKKVKESRAYEMTCGFNTIGETFKAEFGAKKKKGLKVDGPDFVKEFGCKNQEFTLTFNTQTGVLKLTRKGQEKSHMLRINESAGNEYYPYFHIENARLRLLESRELAEDEQAGMDFVLEKDEAISGEDDDDDFEDVDSDDP